jgi:hypothetical protein
VGNSIRDTRFTCIEAIGQALTVVGNNCNDTGGIQVPTNAGAMQGISIVGNSLTNGSGLLGQQIALSGSASNPISAAVISGNSIYFPALAERCIFLNGNATGQIISANVTGNVCQGQGATMTQTGIEAFITLQSNFAENIIRDFSNAAGAGSLGMQIADAASTGNKVGPNKYFNVTTSVQDNGTSTQLFEPFPANAAGAAGISALANGKALQFFNTTTTCTTAATINTPCTTGAITLPVAYTDTSYRLSCQGLGPTQFPQLQTVTKSNTTFTITVNNLTAAAASYTSFDCTAVHN